MLTPYEWGIVFLCSAGLTIWFGLGVYFGCKAIDPLLGNIIFPKDKEKE